MEDTDLLVRYVKGTAAQRVDIIIQNYPEFIGMIEGYTEGLRYMIECDQESVRRSERGELGVRVQKGGSYSNPTQAMACRNIMTREALISCDFSGDVMEGLDRAEEYMREAYVLKDMRKEYTLFQNQLSSLGRDRDFYEKYLNKEMSITEIAANKGITYESAQQKIHIIRSKLKKRVVKFMERKTIGIA